MHREHGRKIRLVIYPGERSKEVSIDGQQHSLTLGHIYVMGASGQSAEIAAGPPPGNRRDTGGGHIADYTRAGLYTLGAAEHHRSQTWPMSVIPWGAPLRKSGGPIEYEVEGRWRPATGQSGDVTRAMMRFRSRDSQTTSWQEADQEVKAWFFDENGHLFDTWIWNDFGVWAWNLHIHGSPSPYFIHTTPENEHQRALGSPITLENSHGCIHISPADRDRLMGLGVLKQGTEVEVKPYGQAGPPR